MLKSVLIFLMLVTLTSQGLRSTIGAGSPGIWSNGQALRTSPPSHSWWTAWIQNDR